MFKCLFCSVPLFQNKISSEASTILVLDFPREETGSKLAFSASI